MADIEAILSKLDLAQKVKLVAGESMWRTFPLEDAGVPVLKVSDGPNGVRGDGGVSAACFPVGICMASTWNTNLLQEIGSAIADEAISKDVQVVLGPTINIHRTPIGGRSFECYSEDPYLSGMLAAAFTDGVQEKGVGACLKHYVCNDSEFERHTISTEVDERTLREIYLRPFELAIKASNPWTVMASYNRINGVYACSNDELVNGVLKGEWAYDGLVMSDWFAAKETVPNALGGLDLEMPGPAAAWGDRLATAVANGEVPEAIIDDKVRRLLRVIDRTGRFEQPDERAELSVNKPDHQQLAYEAATEGMVLLKNSGVLPLDKSMLQKIAVIGPNAEDFRIMGGGSSSLKPHYIATPMTALQDKLTGTEIVSALGCATHKYIPEPARGLVSPGTDSNARGLFGQFFADDLDSEIIAERVIGPATIHIAGRASNAGAARFTGHYSVTESGSYEFGLLSTGQARMYIDDKLIIDNWDDTEPGEAFFTQATSERRATIGCAAGDQVALRIDFKVDPGQTFRALRYGILPPQKEDSIAEAVSLAESADAVILMVGTNDDWETEGNDRTTLALPGDQDRLIEAVLAVNPNTVVVNNSGSPISMPWLESAPAVVQSWFAGQEFGNALADILFGVVNPSGKLPVTFPRRLQDTPAYTSYPGEFGKVHYGEGIFVGYRWYASRDIEPLLPFGHGLSYTSFRYQDLAVSKLVDGVEVSFKLQNTGDRQGKEIAQVYVEAVDSPVAKPRIELKGFAKLDLAPGETQSVSVVLGQDAFAHWDVSLSDWLVPPGTYKIQVGSSSTDLRLSQIVEL
jgi:beta-glucosidase